jgi:hypothetical protein
MLDRLLRAPVLIFIFDESPHNHTLDRIYFYIGRSSLFIYLFGILVLIGEIHMNILWVFSVGLLFNYLISSHSYFQFIYSTSYARMIGIGPHNIKDPPLQIFGYETRLFVLEHLYLPAAIRKIIKCSHGLLCVFGSVEYFIGYGDCLDIL